MFLPPLLLLRVCVFGLVAAIQEKVNACFCDFSESAADKPFLEFSDEGIAEKTKLLKNISQIAKQKGLMDAVKAAFELEHQKKLNPKLVTSALGVFLTHNKEARRLGVVVPPLALQSNFKLRARPRPYPITPDTLQGPAILAYFREDYDLNDHHNHWHQVFPTTGIDDDESPSGVKRRIQRQGELFLYMHSQMLARYNSELHAWGQSSLTPFDYDDIPFFGYTPPPGLLQQYCSRPARQGWYEENNPDIPNNPRPSKAEMNRTRNNILRDIGLGRFYTTNANGDRVGEYQLTEENAMNTVGFVVEALGPDLQVVNAETGERTDRSEYGSIHNNGHNKFAEIGYKTQHPSRFGVMGSVEASLRDHIFWRWHRHVDVFWRIIVNQYTHSLDEYKADAEICQLTIAPRNPNSQTPAGGVATYMCPPDEDRNEVNAKLRHEPYKWTITVKSTLSPPPTDITPQSFTIRIFIALRPDIQDHSAWIEMDKFTVSLTKEEDTFVRKDTDSAVARKVRPYSSNSRCSCGWPQNLMLPVGRPDGLEYVAFAMLTSGELGQVSNF